MQHMDGADGRRTDGRIRGLEAVKAVRSRHAWRPLTESSEAGGGGGGHHATPAWP